MAFLKKKTDPIKGDTTTLVKKDASDPRFSKESDHTSFYRKKAEGKLGGSDKNLYDSLKSRSQADGDAIIALRGGTPKFEIKKKAPQRVVYKSSVKSGVGSGERNTSGYQYNKGLPAKGSVTLIRKKKV